MTDTPTSQRLRSITAKAAFVVAVTVLAWFNVAAAVIAICATILVALHGKAGSLVELSFGPLRAKIERELSEAERLVEKLKVAQATLAKVAAAAGARTGRFAADDDWIFQMTKQIEAALDTLDVTPGTLADVRSELVRVATIDLGHSATGGNHLPMHLPPEAQEEWKDLRDAGKFTDPDVVEQWLLKWDQMTPERKLLIEDMRWIREHNDVKDSEQYMRSMKPIEWSGRTRAAEE